ncbi:ABC transporter permease [uncultured Amnibacterium sp.]|uniref:ABC transporter permease n=1 Tax=uncultured Amnibacterium sp. TaxID=1631851 RepID=UPI0035CAAFB3
MTATRQPSSTFGPGRTLRLGIGRVRWEVRQYFRERDTVFFTFLFPTVIFLVFAAAFSTADPVGARPDGTGGISVAAYTLPGLVAAGVVLSGIQNLGIAIAGERSDGTLKRLGGSPLPVVSYFMGKAGSVLLTALIQLALLLAVARILFDVALPQDATHWVRFIWVFLLSIVMATVLGIGISGIPRSGRSASAVIVPILLVLQFVSGVYFTFADLPGWLQTVAGIFPVKWVAQGMRSVFLPEHLAVAEQHGDWDLGTTALVLVAWTVVGLVAARLTFRWVRKDG